MESNGTDMADTHLSGNGLVANIRHLGDNALGAARYHKVAILIAHTAVNISGLNLSNSICYSVQWDIGEFDRFTFFINNTSNHFRIFLLRTLHEDTVFIVSHLDGIEAYHLAKSLPDGKVTEPTGHSKILQLIIDEIDGLVAISGIQVFEYLR